MWSSRDAFQKCMKTVISLSAPPWRQRDSTEPATLSASWIIEEAEASRSFSEPHPWRQMTAIALWFKNLGRLNRQSALHYFSCNAKGSLPIDRYPTLPDMKMVFLHDYAYFEALWFYPANTKVGIVSKNKYPEIFNFLFLNFKGYNLKCGNLP